MFDLRIPIATYRLQFNGQFSFEDAQVIVPYLSRLGISDLYASPIFKARQGSTHGYDVVDPSRLNPELGTEVDFDALVRKLMDYGMGLLLDIVPNHMAASHENPWWVDLLENGLYSPYTAFFDIDWSAAGNRVLLPILVSHYKKALENQELTLTLQDTGIFVQYHGYRLPLDVKSYSLILSHCLNTLEGALGSSHPDFQRFNQLTNAMERLSSVTSPGCKTTRKQYRERQAVKEALLHIVNTSPKVKTFLLHNIAVFNGKKGEPKSFELMHSLLEQQVYRLAFWKVAREHINYRRFFDINDLVGIRVEDPEVFEVTHALIFQLAQQGKVTGLRVDHIDGLFDPLQYLSRLQQTIAPEVEEVGRFPPFYIVVEKILAGDEVLPPEWPVFGTTGYDFANMVNALFVDNKGVQALDESYSRLTGSPVVFNDVIYEKRRQVIEKLFPGEAKALGHHLADLAHRHQGHHSVTLLPKELTQAVVEVTACLPIYRTYIHTLEVPPRDRFYLERAIEEAQWRNPSVEAAALDFLKHVLLLDFPFGLTPEQKESWLYFVLRWQQLTGAVMAKGFEDTALYTYNRLISLNEVGGDPGSTGLSIDEFHHRNLARLEQCPHTLNATSTHDTKRSEDVRARINVLSEIPEEWDRHLTQWSQWNQPKKQTVNGLAIPEPDIEILLYQTLIGAWPLYKQEVTEFKQRLKVYMVKAVREAKVFTNWLLPNSDYESALIKFLESVLEGSKQNDFLEDFLRFESQIAYYGALNSLAQVLLKTTSPGVPDFYQGTELWDFSLVDPDNRRPVDFRRRIELLDGLTQQEARGQQSLIQQALSMWEDGRVKLYVTYKALNVRKSYSDVFQDGEYIPLQVAGQRQEHVLAFGRHKGKAWLMVVVPRLLTKLGRFGATPVSRGVWEEDSLLLPEGMPERWFNIFTGEHLKVSATGKKLALSDILCIFPMALLVNI